MSYVFDLRNNWAGRLNTNPPASRYGQIGRLSNNTCGCRRTHPCRRREKGHFWAGSIWQGDGYTELYNVSYSNGAQNGWPRLTSNGCDNRMARGIGRPI